VEENVVYYTNISLIRDFIIVTFVPLLAAKNHRENGMFNATLLRFCIVCVSHRVIRNVPRGDKLHVLNVNCFLVGQ
jgi:hypothetical protein